MDIQVSQKFYHRLCQLIIEKELVHILTPISRLNAIYRTITTRDFLLIVLVGNIFSQLLLYNHSVYLYDISMTLAVFCGFIFSNFKAELATPEPYFIHKLSCKLGYRNPFDDLISFDRAMVDDIIVNNNLSRFNKINNFYDLYTLIFYGEHTLQPKLKIIESKN